MLQKRLDYGSNGFQVPFIPKAARSSRRRGGVGKKAEDNQLCAFDLLATVAGNLLLEGETSQNTPVEENQAVNYEDVVMEEQHDEVNPSKIEHCDQPVSDNPPFNLVLGSLNAGIETVPKDNASLIPAVVDKIDLNDHLGDEFCNHLAKPEQCSAAVPKDFDMRNQGEDLSQNSSYKQSLSTNNYTSGSVSPSRGGTNVNNNNDNIVKVVSRDDDENSSGCTHPSSLKLTRWPPRAGGRRIRRLLASKHRRVAPKLKDRDVSETELRYVYCGRKNGYKRQRSQRIYPFKKRKSFYYRTLSNCDRNINYKSIYSPEKGLDKSTASFGAVGHGVKGSSSSVSGQSTSFQSRESQVKVRIKSFRVPELFIEMPETATIGSLKRTVMETLTTLLGGGLHVGVLFQGKKMRDDNRTLLQSGIGRNDKVDSLGFTLEPNCVDANVPISSEDNSLVLSSDVPQPLSRCPDVSMMNGETCHPSSSDHPMNSIGHLVESDHDSAPSPGETSGDKGTVDSRALVAVPEGTPQALSVIPAHHKSKRAEMAQRRIRRPFSVTEVEALVQAVEQLGTGRWRDVKLRAFDDAKHRTYVDLKDKWKTLVHTARISPQQRRGEPVPQELLDRVLAAHAYWSQQQAKQQLKQQPEPCLLL